MQSSSYSISLGHLGLYQIITDLLYAICYTTSVRAKQKWFQCSELANAQKDVEKLKEELNSKDIKIKWTQNKLKAEMDTCKVLWTVFVYWVLAL